MARGAAVDDRRRELAQALRTAGVREVDTSSRRRAEYSSDASLYRVLPLAVAFPRDGDEVAAAVETCNDLGVGLTPRGGGTSVAGNAVGPGLVLDLSRHLVRIRSIDAEARTADVDAGAVLGRLQRAAAPHGLRFGPDPSTQDRCTLGGMIGNDACGPRALGYGRTADNVRTLELVTGDGRRLAIDAGRRAERAVRDLGGSPTSIGRDAAALVERHAGAVREQLGRFSRQVSGFALDALLPENGTDLARALVGTEGTCAVSTRATVRLVERPGAVVLVVLGYPDMATAADDCGALVPLGPLAVEGLDARIVDAVRARGVVAVPDLPRGRGWLFVEVGGGGLAEATSNALRLAAASEAIETRVVTGAEEIAALWRIRADGAGSASRTASGAPAHAGWEDAAVPPAVLGDYLRDFDRLMDQHGVSGLPYGHFGDGCVHVRIDLTLGGADGAAVLRRFVEDATDLVVGYGGSLSGEHGDGRARGEMLDRMYDSEVRGAFAAFRRLFDPAGICNPGVIVDPRPLDADLRPVGLPTDTASAFALVHDGGDLINAVHRCVGVGSCRADAPGAGTGKVMCPSFQATRDERDSTRGRARVLQEAVTGGLGPDGLRSEAVRDALDLCLACKGCSSDCPTGVDVATYKAEVLHRTYRRRLRPRSHYTLGWLPRWSRLAGAAPRLVNAVLRRPALGRLARRAAGVDRRRDLPVFAPTTLRSWHETRDDRPAPAGRTPITLFCDSFTDRFTPEVGIDAIRLLERVGYTVSLSSPDACCGLTWISTGQLDGARRRLRRTVTELAADARAGHTIVGVEPSCTAVLRSDAVELLGPDDPDAATVAAATRTLAEVLASRRPSWTPPRLDGIEIVVQAHCHQHAVIGFGVDERLLRSTGATVTRVDGCCGLAGNFGAEDGHFEVSVQVAETSLLPALRAAPDAVVLADGFSCRTQLDQLAPGRQVRHLAGLLLDGAGPARATGSPAADRPG